MVPLLLSFDPVSDLVPQAGSFFLIRYIIEDERVGGHALSGGTPLLNFHYCDELPDGHQVASYLDERAYHGAHYITEEAVGIITNGQSLLTPTYIPPNS